MIPDEVKRYDHCYHCLDIKATPIPIVGKTKERIWLRTGDKLLILDIEQAKEYNKIYDYRRRN